MDLQGEGSIILTDQWIWTKKPHSTKFVYVHTPLSIMNKPWQFGMDVMRSILHGKWENNQKLEIDVLTFCQTQSSEASHILNIMTWTFWIYLSPYLKWFLRVHSHVHAPDLNRPFQMLHLFASSLYPHFVGILSVCLNTKCPCRTPPQSLRTRQQHSRSLASIDLYLFRLLPIHLRRSWRLDHTRSRIYWLDRCRHRYWWMDPRGCMSRHWNIYSDRDRGQRGFDINYHQNVLDSGRNREMRWDRW